MYIEVLISILRWFSCVFFTWIKIRHVIKKRSCIDQKRQWVEWDIFPWSNELITYVSVECCEIVLYIFFDELLPLKLCVCFIFVLFLTWTMNARYDMLKFWHFSRAKKFPYSQCSNMLRNRFVFHRIRW